MTKAGRWKSSRQAGSPFVGVHPASRQFAYDGIKAVKSLVNEAATPFWIAEPRHLVQRVFGIPDGCSPDVGASLEGLLRLALDLSARLHGRLVGLQGSKHASGIAFDRRLRLCG